MSEICSTRQSVGIQPHQKASSAYIFHTPIPLFKLIALYDIREVFRLPIKNDGKCCKLCGTGLFVKHEIIISSWHLPQIGAITMTELKE